VTGYRLTPRARDGLIRIADYVERNFGTLVADRVVLELSTAFEKLAGNSGLGHRREDLTDDPHVRFWSVGPTLIAYRDADDWIDVLFVEPGARDWEQLIREHLT
jgi:toxin ParE1/3/4